MNSLRVEKPLLIGVVILLVALAGCGGTVGNKPTVSNVEATVLNNKPAVVFNYSTSDSATVLVKGPSGRVLGTDTLEPNKSGGSVVFSDADVGNYTFLIRKRNKRVSKRTVHFGGPNVSLTNTSTQWSGTTLSQVIAPVRNSGDLPARVLEVKAAVHGKKIHRDKYVWIAPNATKTISAETEIKIREGTMVRGTVTVKTETRTLQDRFSQAVQNRSS
ncbi:MAG: hypothetical protein ABEK02_02155 [Haloquadratum sp.]